MAEWQATNRREVGEEYFHNMYTRDVVGLTAPEVAPVGLENIGHPVTCSPATCAGAPSLTLPLLAAHDLPLGLHQVTHIPLGTRFVIPDLAEDVDFHFAKRRQIVWHG